MVGLGEGSLDHWACALQGTAGTLMLSVGILSYVSAMKQMILLFHRSLLCFAGSSQGPKSQGQLTMGGLREEKEGKKGKRENRNPSCSPNSLIPTQI